MNLKYGIAVAAITAICVSAPAFAGSSSTATSYSSSGAMSSSNGVGTGGSAGSVVNFTYTDPPAPADPTTTTSKIITTGTAIAPSLYSNNVCALQAGAAGGFLGGAFSFGFDRVDHGCDVRANAALLGHFAEINTIEAEHAPDPQIRAAASQAAITYGQWANNYICMQNPDLAAAAPPGSGVCHSVATQTGMSVVPAPVAMPVQAVVVAPPTPVIGPQLVAASPSSKPHVLGPHEAVSSSYRTGKPSGYWGPTDID